MPVKIVSDTTAELPAEMRERWDIQIVPQYIHFGEETFRDEFEITAEEFYRRQAEADELPKTSAPPPADFLPIFKEHLTSSPEATILCLHPSAEVSGTVRSALTAKSQLQESNPEADIRVVDTRLISVGLGLLVLEAAKMAAGGASVAAITAQLDQMRASSRTYFVVQTLEYLAKGGRIGRASHLMGSLLDIKPILELQDGVVEAHSKARTRKRSLAAMFDLVVEHAESLRADGGQLQLGIAHARCHEEASELASQLEAALEPDFSLLTVNGPAIGVHAGPGSLAVSCLTAP